MDFIFGGITALVALYALGKWRDAMYGAILLDALRDPVRKISALQSSITTVIVAVVWFAALIGSQHQDQREMRLLFQRYPRLRNSVVLLLVSLIPGLLVSTLFYENGWLLASIGVVSYTAPFLGVALGYLWPRRLQDVYRWMAMYCVVNSVMALGSLFEVYGMDFPGLGGMNMKWLRNYGTDMIPLICGFYRSPDVMGIHAAHVIMFASLLAIRLRNRNPWPWIGLVAWEGFSLLVCGRRKMIAIPLVFLVSSFALWAIMNGRKKIAISMALMVTVAISFMAILSEGVVADNEYTRFASSIASEGVDRAGRSLTDNVFTTIRQSGLFGDGLGTVTQGRQYMGVVTRGHDWQEDGVGRLVKELGIPGTICILWSVWLLISSLWSALQAIPANSPMSTLQFGLFGIIVANAASFSVSHQAYSGDPSTVLMVGFFAGMILGMPRAFWSEVTPITPSAPTEQNVVVAS